LRFRAPREALTPQLRDELGTRRAEVVAHLRAEASASAQASPLSYSQRSLWLVHQEDPASPAYNVAFTARVASAVDVAALREALQALVDRHASLRTTYPLVDGLPVQRIAGATELSFEAHDVAGMDEAALSEVVHASYRRPFDLVAGPVFRAELFSRSQADHVLMLNVHHIAADGMSMMQLLDDLRALYTEAAGGAGAALPRTEVDYAGFTKWQLDMLGGAEGRRLLEYWGRQLAAPRAEVELPADRRRPTRRSGAGASHGFELDADLAVALRALAREEGTTLFVVMLALFQALLFRHTGTEDVIVGTPTAGRSRPDFARIVGHFVNPVAIRGRLAGTMSFRELLAQLRPTVLDAVDAQDCPFPLVVEHLRPARDPARSPIFETMFVLQRFDGMRELEAALVPGAAGQFASFGGLRLGYYPLAQQEGQFELTLQVVDVSGPMPMLFKYNTELYDTATIERLAGHLRVLARGIVSDPARPLGRVVMLPPQERAELIASAGEVASAPGPQWTLHQRFEEQARKTPEAIAATHEGSRLTYAELNARANRLAHRLRALGVERETLVGLCCEPSLDLIVGLVAILKAGGAYLPIDLAYPAERVAFMLEDAKAPVLVTQRALEARVPARAGTTVFVDDEALASGPDANPEHRNAPDDLVYVIYTSGSTGKPKGTMLTHRAVQRLFTATEAWYGFGAADVWTMFHSVAFDFSVWELWGALLYGGRVVVVPHAVTRDAVAFRALLHSESVTVLNQTPSAFSQLLQADLASGPPQATKLRYVIFGGEALELQRLRPWFERHGDSQPQLVNMYGITETCVHVTYRPIGLADLAAGAGSVIGVPIPDLRVHVLDAAMEPMPCGVAGEMYVGGPGLARGYLERPELTAARFVPDPFVPGERLYRTGDLARRRSGGELEYLGRIDHQVKVRGFRIELGEIEAALSAHPALAECLVVAREPTPGDQRLVAYVVYKKGEELTVSEVRRYLRKQLPDYMVPSVIVALDAMPLTANGKVDRPALPDPFRNAQRATENVEPPAPGIEQVLADIWRELLKVEHVGAHDNFFELGGHSLLSLSVVAAVTEKTGWRMDSRALFFQTLRQVAATFPGKVPAGNGGSA
jgi:amino acid adenylation domain-containing protein